MPEPSSAAFWPCCDHCGCGTPTGYWQKREGHDDTCRHGCNDAEVDDLLEHVDE